MAGQHILLRYRLWLLGAGVCLFLYLLLRLNPDEVFGLLFRIGWSFFGILLMYGGYEAFRTLALWHCLDGRGRASLWALAKIRLTGEAVQFLTLTGPFLAEPAKAALLQKYGIRPPDAFAATIAEFLTYSYAAAGISIAGLLYLRTHYSLDAPVAAGAGVIVYVLSGFLLASSMAIIFRIYLIGMMINGLQRLPLVGAWIVVDPEEVRATEDRLLHFFRDQPIRFLRVAMLEMAAHVMLVLEILVFLWSIGEPFALLHPFLLEAVTKFIAMAFFFVPGHVGAAEGIYALAFQQVGMSAAAGFTLAFIRRLRSLLTAGAGLILAPLWTSSGESKEQAKDQYS